jgi:hypothetical protein
MLMMCRHKHLMTGPAAAKSTENPAIEGFSGSPPDKGRRLRDRGKLMGAGTIPLRHRGFPDRKSSVGPDKRSSERPIYDFPASVTITLMISLIWKGIYNE